MSKKQKQEKHHIGDALLSEMWSIGMAIYLLVIFLFLPTYIYDHYWDMALNKWKVYLYSSCWLLIFAAGMLVVGGIYAVCFKRGEWKKKLSRKWYLTDIAVALYGGLVLTSFGLCMDKSAAWMGIDGWYMGLIAQLLFVITYFVFSWKRMSAGVLMLLHGGASAFCYFYAVCQRLGADWMHLYWEMPAEVKRDYISTIGNRTWFSAYICTAFPIGMYLFWRIEAGWKRRLAGLYVLLAFLCMVVVGSDSLYMALMVILYVLVLFSVGNMSKVKRVLELVMLWFFGCGSILLLRACVVEYFKDIRGISQFFLTGKVVAVALLLLVVCWLGLSLKDGTIKCKYFVVKNIGFRERKAEHKRQWRLRLLLLTGVLVLLLLGLIWSNSAGVLQEVLGITIDNKYLLFDDNWGDYRGRTWKLTMHMFSELPIKQKLFGVGPDCYAYHAYNNSEYAGVLRSFWGETIMPNAHNEWLNSLFCFGLLGGFAYLVCFAGSAYECLVKVDVEKVHPLIPGSGLVVVAYMAHNFFCYQQVCATPFIFILMGVAMRLKKDIVKKD